MVIGFANTGGIRRAVTTAVDSFTRLVDDAIDASSLTELARRWGTHESTLRNWRDGKSVAFDTLRRLRLGDDELLRLLRMLARGRFRILPAEDAVAPTMDPTGLRAAGITLARHAVELQEETNKALADGVIDDGERARLNLISDEIQRDAERARPEGLLARFRRFVGRGG